MRLYEKSLSEMNQAFGKDIQYAFATVDQDQPYVRIVDGFFHNGSIYISTYGLCRKVLHIDKNPKVSLCYKLNTFKGICKNIGHPKNEENKEIREVLKKVFHLFYENHVNEEDPNTCFLKVDLTCAVMFDQNKKYAFNFRSQEVFVSNHVDDMIYLP
ncbi:MAG: pyridoxamine 5'-phosphate oxidase family protein [Acholeplasmataceae bacterium]|nr:pyridoxamine 5'-phosphate oxidase family protein [Acholeplasmataceae bacterium]